jgi:molybdopterin converting factor small subunit
MVIEVRVFASLCHYVPDSDRHLDGHKWDMVEGTKVGQVLDLLNIPEEEAKILLINGRHADRERALNEGDVLHVFPPMCGG